MAMRPRRVSSNNLNHGLSIGRCSKRSGRIGSRATIFREHVALMRRGPSSKTFSLASLAREERVEERRAVLFEFPSPQPSPHSFLVGRGTRQDVTALLDSMAVAQASPSADLLRLRLVARQ